MDQPLCILVVSSGNAGSALMHGQLRKRGGKPQYGVARALPWKYPRRKTPSPRSAIPDTHVGGMTTGALHPRCTHPWLSMLPPVRYTPDAPPGRPTPSPRTAEFMPHKWVTPPQAHPVGICNANPGSCPTSFARVQSGAVTPVVKDPPRGYFSTSSGTMP